MIPNKADAIASLRPDAEWVLRGDDLEWLDTNQTEPTEAEIEAELARLTAEQPWKILRQRRDQLLTETDYLALADSTMTDEMQAYRQALRDLPANTEDPANPVWPTKPS
jgi:lysophospholipase L1-like esterase